MTGQKIHAVHALFIILLTRSEISSPPNLPHYHYLVQDDRKLNSIVHPRSHLTRSFT